MSKTVAVQVTSPWFRIHAAENYHVDKLREHNINFSKVLNKLKYRINIGEKTRYHVSLFSTTKSITENYKISAVMNQQHYQHTCIIYVFKLYIGNDN